MQDSIQLRKASLHEGLTDTQTVKNKHYRLELAVFWKVYPWKAANQVDASSEECFQVFLSKEILWEPLPHTLVFFIFLSHLGPLQGSAAPLVLTPSSNLLPQPLDNEIPQVCKQPLRFSADLSVVCHLEPKAFGGKSKKNQSQVVLDMTTEEDARWCMRGNLHK